MHYRVRFHWLPERLGRFARFFTTRLDRLGKKHAREMTELRELVELLALAGLTRDGARPAVGSVKRNLERMVRQGNIDTDRFRRLVQARSVDENDPPKPSMSHWSCAQDAAPGNAMRAAAISSRWCDCCPERPDGPESRGW